MASNLVSLIMQMLTPDLVTRIASALGLDRAMVSKALEAVVPGVLAALTGVTSTPDGARKVAEAASRQSPNVRESLDRLISGADRATAVDDGTDLLSPLLGRSATTALTEAVGKFTGLPGGTSTSLLGIVTPLVLGALGSQQKASGLDAAGLAQTLQSQKRDIEAAVPAGFATLLKQTGFLDAAEGVQPSRPATPAAPPSPPSLKRATGGSSWARTLTWLIPLALLAALVLWYLTPGPQRVTEQAPVTPAPTQAAATATAPSGPVPTQTGASQFAQGLEQRLASLRGLGASGVEAANEISGAFGSLTSTLQGITDQATAQSALPQLKEASSQVDKLLRSAESLPAEGRKALYGFVATALPAINTLLDKVLAIPGVSAAIKPTVDELRTKLDDMAKQA